MPRYKYRCEKCGGDFELVQGIKESAESECYLTVDDKRCRGEVVRVPSIGGFSLKGKGWYRDGY